VERRRTADFLCDVKLLGWSDRSGQLQSISQPVSQVNNAVTKSAHCIRYVSLCITVDVQVQIFANCHSGNGLHHSPPHLQVETHDDVSVCSYTMPSVRAGRISCKMDNFSGLVSRDVVVDIRDGGLPYLNHRSFTVVVLKFTLRHLKRRCRDSFHKHTVKTFCSQSTNSLSKRFYDNVLYNSLFTSLVMCRCRDTLVVTLANYFTGIFAGFVVFSFLGFMAGTMNASVDEVVDSGKLSSPYLTPVLILITPQCTGAQPRQSPPAPTVVAPMSTHKDNIMN